MLRYVLHDGRFASSQTLARWMTGSPKRSAPKAKVDVLMMKPRETQMDRRNTTESAAASRLR
jgi:hypothetical protein